MSLLRPLRRHKRKADKAYLAWLHSLQCLCFGLREDSPCEGRIIAHHAGDRGLMQRPPDRTALPFCERHGGRDHKHGAHVLGRRFWEFFGLDKNECIATLNAAYEAGGVA